jgi:acyl-CoA carboxylase epsilon subunit
MTTAPSADARAVAAADPGLVLRVVRGPATAEEVAALAVVLLAASSGDAEGPAAARADGLRRGGEAAWGNRSALLRRSLPPGPDAWRAGSRPG